MWQTLSARDSIEIARDFTKLEGRPQHPSARQNRAITGAKQGVLAYLQGTHPGAERIVLRICSAHQSRR